MVQSNAGEPGGVPMAQEVRQKAGGSVRIALQDGREVTLPASTSLEDTLHVLHVPLGTGSDRVLGADAGGRIMELRRPVGADTVLRPLTFEDPRGQRILRHTAAHMLAQAVKRIMPEAYLGTGPATDDGFFYDIQFPTAVGPEMLPLLEAEMRKIAAEDLPVARREISREEALTLFQERGEPFKLELIENLPEGTPLSVYTQGEFTDLCRGPHVPSTGYVGALRLLSVAGAYWHGDESKPMLSRVYGTAFPDEASLDAYLERVEEAKKRDHRKLGRELGLFTFMEEAPGIPFWLPRGVAMIRLLEGLMRRLQTAEGYREVRTPQLMTAALWQRSGHWDHYRENMFVATTEDGEMVIKPMNCPGAVLLFSQGLHSYRELPLRLMDFGGLHRNERSGTLHGLLRTRNFVQDDAHIFVTPDGIGPEIARVLDLIDRVYAIFGLRYHLELSTRPENSMGDDSLWERAEAALTEALSALGRAYAVNPGDGAFYGPKIDVHVEDSLGRRWQCGTVQLDFQLPERFSLEYVGPDGMRHRPIMIHRAILGTLERFSGVLVEHFAGSFPVWLAPAQIAILPVAERHEETARALESRLLWQNLRPEVKTADEKLGRRIRAAELEKIPYMAVIGDRELESGSVSLRRRGEGDLGSVSFEALGERLQAESSVDGVGRL